MAETVLVAPKRKAGEKLIRSLDEAGMPIFAAFWFWDPDAEDWRFVLGSDLVNRVGPIETLRRVQTVLRAGLPHRGIALREVLVVGRKDPLLDILRDLPRTDRMGVVSIPVHRALLAGHFVEGAHIYRSS